MRHQPIAVIDDPSPPAHMNRDVIPRRNHLAVFLLARIPGRAYVVVRALKYGQRLRTVSRFPVAIRARKMASENVFRGMENCRNMSGLRTVPTICEKRGEWIPPDKLMQNFDSILGEIRRIVHSNNGTRRSLLSDPAGRRLFGIASAG